MKKQKVCPTYAVTLILTAGLLGIAAPAVALAYALSGNAPVVLLPAAVQQAPEASENGPAKEKADSMEKLQEVRTRMQEEKKALSHVMAREGHILDKLEALQKNLQKSKNRLEKLESQMTMVKEESRLLSRNIKRMKRRARDLQDSMNKRLRAHYRFTRTGMARVLFTATDVADLSRRMSYMDAVFRADKKKLDEYTSLLQDWQKARERLKDKKELYAELKKTTAEQQEQRREEKESLQAMLESVRQERRRHQALLRDLEASKKRLQGMIQKLEQKKDQLMDKASKLVEKAKGFASRRGSLCYPASGPIRVSFGKKVHPRFNTETMQNGVEIGASAGKPVKAVAPGVVRFAKWFRGYGNMVIVDHGNGFYTVYAHLADIRAGTGDEVKTGTVLGTVGDTGSMQGPSLYFEIRHHQDPVNPEDWLGSCSM
ncbi:MAG: peptidoglycan DD-metalloendopeptidase family protein [bacterium]